MGSSDPAMDEHQRNAPQDVARIVARYLKKECPPAYEEFERSNVHLETYDPTCTYNLDSLEKIYEDYCVFKQLHCDDHEQNAPQDVARIVARYLKKECRPAYKEFERNNVHLVTCDPRCNPTNLDSLEEIYENYCMCKKYNYDEHQRNVPQDVARMVARYLKKECRPGYKEFERSNVHLVIYDPTWNYNLDSLEKIYEDYCLLKQYNYDTSATVVNKETH